LQNFSVLALKTITNWGFALKKLKAMRTMKKIGIHWIGILLLWVGASTMQAQAQGYGRVSFQLFYDQLAPYGDWVNDPEYGYIWLPAAGPDFRPYATNGYWVATHYGNTWVSNYDWGWAPFHYGRWFYDDYYGWAWGPGYEWGPAWVDWRSGNGHYGWAPLGPQVRVGVHISIPSSHWVFVPQRYILSPRVHHYYVGHRNVVKIYNRTTIIKNTYIYNNRQYVSGPSHRELERATRSRVVLRDVQGSNRPGGARVEQRAVQMYRPEVDQNTRSAARPSQVLQRDQVRGTQANTRAVAVTRQNEAVRSQGASTSRNNATATAPARNTQTVRSNAGSREAVTSGNGSNGRSQATGTTRNTATQRNNTTSRERVDASIPPVRSGNNQNSGSGSANRGNVARENTTTRTQGVARQSNNQGSTATSRNTGAQARQTQSSTREAVRNNTQSSSRNTQTVRGSSSERSNTGNASRGNASRTERGNGSTRGN
jgi:hypothetical protein